MKENHLIGSILADAEESPINMSNQPGRDRDSRDPLAEAKLKYANVRSSSAPPVLPDNEFKTASPVNAETINPQDPRLDPAYYTYYYSQRPLDPRLPPPLIGPYGGTPNMNSSFSHFPFMNQQQNGQQSPNDKKGSSDDDMKPSDKEWSPSLVDSSQEVKPKSLVDKIQQDFPRTPSPIYQVLSSQKPRDEPNIQPQQRVLQPQPQQRSQILQHPQQQQKNSSSRSTSTTNIPNVLSRTHFGIERFYAESLYRWKRNGTRMVRTTSSETKSFFKPK